MAHFLEFFQVIYNHRTEESLSVLQGRLINNDRCALRLDALHNALNRALTEVIRVGLHGQTINTNSHRLFLLCVVLVILVIAIIASQL